MTRNEILKTAKPILFNTEMVRAILDGRKTAIRQPMEPQPILKGRLWMIGGAGWSENISTIYPVPCHSLYNRMPYHEGDYLYVQETASTETAQIFLRVTGVRVERLQGISRDDTATEGAPCCLRLYRGYCGNGGLCVCDDYKQEFASLWNSIVKKSYLDKYGWDANPWVWVIEFERVE